MKRQSATVSTKTIARMLELEHDDILAMLTMILMKHPRANNEFIIDKLGYDYDVQVTSKGVGYIIDYMLKVGKIDLLIDLMKELNEGE